MMTGHKNLRNLFTMPLFRAAVLGIFQKISCKGLGLARLLIAEHAWNHAGNRIHHNHGRKLAACKHIISDRHIIRHNFLQNTLVNPLIVTAKENQVFLFRHVSCHLLIKHLSLRGEINHTGALPGFLGNRFISQVNRFCLHQHSSTAAVSIIIYFLVLVKSIVADIYGLHRKDSCINSTPCNAGVHSIPDHFRKKGQNMEIHL